MKAVCTLLIFVLVFGALGLRALEYLDQEPAHKPDLIQHVARDRS